MNTVRRASLALLVAASLVASVSGCAQQHATLADCVTWMTKQLAERGSDPSLVSKDIQAQCERNKDTMTQDEFDRFLG